MNQSIAKPNETAVSGKDDGGGQRLTGRAKPTREAIEAYQKCTKAQQRLLDIMLTSEAASMTNEQICEKAGVAVSTLWRAEKNHRFLAARNAMAHRLIDVHIGSIVRASVDTAVKPGKDGHLDRRMLMEIAQVYEPTQNVNVTGKINHEHEVGDRLGQAIFNANAHRNRMKDENQGEGADAAPVIEGRAEAIDVDQGGEPEPVEDEEFAPI